MSADLQQSKTTFFYGLHFKEGHQLVDPNASKNKSLFKKTPKVRHTYQKVEENAEKFISYLSGGIAPAAQPPKPSKPSYSPFKPFKPSKPTPAPVPTHAPTPVLQQQPITGTKRALLIGINYYGTGNQLNGCIKDVQNIYTLLTSSYKYKPENIKTLSDDQSGGFKPTRANIIDNIISFVALTKPGDELFVHYSGHGTQVPDTNGDEKLNPDTPGKDDALCPCDFDDFSGVSGFITDDVLREILVNKIPKGAKLRAFFDCCHSGSILDLPFLYKSGDVYAQVEPLDKESADCLMISGCKDSQTSADAFINGQYSGALTWAIIQALTSSAQVKTTWKEFLLVLRHNLAAARYTQIPMISVGDQAIANFSIDL